MMYCGPIAVAELTGWSKDDVWLHIRWLREANGERLTRHPRGGTKRSECFSALDKAGYDVELVFANKRRDFVDFCENEGRTGHWLLRQHKHMLAYLSEKDRATYGRKENRGEYARITHAWRITKRKEWRPFPTKPCREIGRKVAE